MNEPAKDDMRGIFDILVVQLVEHEKGKTSNPLHIVVSRQTLFHMYNLQLIRPDERKHYCKLR